MMLVSLVFGLIDALKGAGFAEALPDVLSHLPLGDQGLAWLVPAVVTLAAAVVVDRLWASAARRWLEGRALDDCAGKIVLHEKARYKRAF